MILFDFVSEPRVDPAVMREINPPL